ncbi:T-lymphocyte activation antigen CD80-like [Genypterus blacodes]|uniref:T-lymphocyte activation antigen CD80-like n=1 Tax=Genypterus blacodes TaxID=154954 RepID=UPI003F7702FC
MPVLWHAGLLLSLSLSYCACLEECVLGIIGNTVSLPCFYNGLNRTSVNFSITWKRDSEVVLRSVWEEDGYVKTWSTNSTNVSRDAPHTGNFSLQIPIVNPIELNATYSLFISLEKNVSAPLCTVCLRIAARFSSPRVQREEPVQGNETVFLCHTSGGFPIPVVHWLINDKEEPPQGLVRTLAAPLPDSPLYNITSQLTINISQDTSVSCIIDNRSMNETLTSTSHGTKGNKVENRASEAMWMFSTGLCVVVGAMVLAGVAYQIHMDRNKKKHIRLDKAYNRRRHKAETELTQSTVDCLLETDV